MRASRALVLACAACSSPPSCPVAASSPVAVGNVSPSLGEHELSGLAASRVAANVLWTQGDDSDADVYAISAQNAGLRGTLHLPGADAVDWEDIAVAPCDAGSCIYIADTGDNDLTRATVAIYQVTEPAEVVVGTRDTAWIRYELRYPDRAHDVEAVFVDPRDGAAYGLTKVDAGAATVFRLPLTGGAISTAVVVGAFAPPSGDPRVTAADFTVDDCGARLGIRTHDRLFELRGDAAATIASLLAADPIELPVADEPQGEGFAFGDGAYFTLGEGTTSPLWRVADQ